MPPIYDLIPRIQTITPPGEFDVYKEDGRHDFCSAISLQGQGEIAVLSVGLSSVETALAFATLFDVASEILVQTEDKNYIRVFSRLEEDEEAQSSQIENSLWHKISKTADSSIDKPQKTKGELHINLAAVWAQVSEEKHTLDKVTEFIDKIERIFQSSEEIYLSGTLQTLALCFAIELAKYKSKKLYYSETESSIQVSLFL